MSGLCVENLSYYNFPQRSFSVRLGDCLGVSGASGVGKSLLLKAIADLIPHQGCVFYQRVEQQSIAAVQWRRHVGLLLAENCWWHETVGAHFKADYQKTWLLSLGFEVDVLAWSVRRLSSGEKQRLALLRLLSCRPSLLLLDEPTANLDSKNAQCVEQLIYAYQQGHTATIVWVSHDLDQIARVAQDHYLMEP